MPAGASGMAVEERLALFPLRTVLFPRPVVAAAVRSALPRICCASACARIVPSAWCESSPAMRWGADEGAPSIASVDTTARVVDTAALPGGLLGVRLRGVWAFVSSSTPPMPAVSFAPGLNSSRMPPPLAIRSRPIVAGNCSRPWPGWMPMCAPRRAMSRIWRDCVGAWPNACHWVWPRARRYWNAMMPGRCSSGWLPVSERPIRGATAGAAVA